MHLFLLCRVSERPTSEEKSGVDLLGYLKGYGFIHEKLMEPHIEQHKDDPVSSVLGGGEGGSACLIIMWVQCNYMYMCIHVYLNYLYIYLRFWLRRHFASAIICMKN
jgi:hypothetical protein